MLELRSKYSQNYIVATLGAFSQLLFYEIMMNAVIHEEYILHPRNLEQFILAMKYVNHLNLPVI